MLLPIWTDRELSRTPWVNYALIALNVIVFLYTRNQLNNPHVAAYMLQPLHPSLVQFITYQFLHANVSHIVGNMVFLYVFGNSVEDRLGKAGYLLFYLAGGVIAGVGHCLTSYAPVLGASGSIATVTGAFLALFPRTNITIALFLILIIPLFEVSGFVLILFQVGMDFVFYLVGTGHTAYSAHLAGYTTGFMVGMGLLLTRVLAREPYDLLSIFEQRRRRAQFKKLTRSGKAPWVSPQGGRGTVPRGEAAPPTPRQQRLMERRAVVAGLMQQQKLDEAADRYLKLLEDDPDQVLGEQAQLDLANHLMAQGRYDEAAGAYELFLKSYTRYPQREQVQLILGLIYARYLHQRQRAGELLNAALPRLTGDDQVLARQVIGELE